MPYIPQEDRKVLDKLLQKLIEELKKNPPRKLDGKVNYVIKTLEEPLR
ncbi:MAG: hypothetical protein J7K98_02460 [Candidatus Aenigmarchaeota archaeon]|nr:hypothetical protein [Candidatus Aenigmarchaeota archaeon]